MGTTPSTFPASVASFSSATYNFDPLLADECISISAQLSSGQGILKRGQVLCGWAVGTARNVALSTAGAAGTVCAILAQDTDTGAGGPVTSIVYVQGKFLVTGLIASANGLEIDSAELWNVGCYVLTVEQRSGLLVPWRSFPATPGVPLPQALTAKEARAAIDEQVDAIKAAEPIPDVPLGGMARAQDPAWAIAAFGQRTQSEEDEAREKLADHATDLDAKQRLALAALDAKHAKERADLFGKLHTERATAAKHEEETLNHARQADAAKAPHPPVLAPSHAPPPAPKK